LLLLWNSYGFLWVAYWCPAFSYESVLIFLRISLIIPSIFLNSPKFWTGLGGKQPRPVLTGEQMRMISYTHITSAAYQDRIWIIATRVLCCGS
jgi:hypothetical protein